MASITLFMAVLNFLGGIATWWANPRRLTNRGFSCFWLIGAIWLVLVHLAIKAENHIAAGVPADPIPFLRWNAVVAAFVQPVLWLIAFSIDDRPRAPWTLAANLVVRLGLAAVLVGFCLTPSFVQPADNAVGHVRGWPYGAYSILGLAIYFALIVELFLQGRRERGIRRVEMHHLGVSIGIACCAATALTAIGNFYGILEVRRAAILVYFGAFALAAYSMTAYRIFDVRQVLAPLSLRLSIATIVAVGIIVLPRIFSAHASESAALLLSIVVCAVLGFWLERLASAWLFARGERELFELRASIIATSRQEASLEDLMRKIEALLQNITPTTERD